jgi:hypothetical protein
MPEPSRGCQALKTSALTFQRVSLPADAEVWLERRDALRRHMWDSVAGLFTGGGWGTRIGAGISF